MSTYGRMNVLLNTFGAPLFHSQQIWTQVYHVDIYPSALNVETFFVLDMRQK